MVSWVFCVAKWDPLRNFSSVLGRGKSVCLKTDGISFTWRKLKVPTFVLREVKCGLDTTLHVEFDRTVSLPQSGLNIQSQSRSIDSGSNFAGTQCEKTQ